MSDKFSKAVQILKNLNQPDRVINRDRINFTKLMHVLKNPFNNFRSIHITGTNGKGSVSIKTAKILEKAGCKAGVYTSPHLFSFRERIQINGELISREDIADRILKVDDVAKVQKIPLSYFQYLTAAGFLYFSDMKCDYVALEVGLGGKNDTTNIVNPQVSVITSIGLDHMDLLGPTKQHIAKQKAGIIKPNRPVVLGPNAQGYKGIQQQIRATNSKVYLIPPQSYSKQNFDSENNAITTQVISCLKTLNPSLTISPQHIETGLKAFQPCRMQKLNSEFLPKWAKNKSVYFDVGHNPQAIAKVRQFLNSNGFKPKDVCFVFGTSRGKKFEECLRQIEEMAECIYLVEANHFRACKIEDIQSYVGISKYPYKFRIFADGNIAKTLQLVTAYPQYKIIVISGSFFIMPEARGFFEPSLISSPQQNINEIYQLQQKNQQKQ